MSGARIEAIAAEMLAAFDGHTQIAPFTSRDPDFDVAQAYAVAAAACRMRIARGEKPIGRKIGFTNRGIWDEYNVDAPIWGYMYEHSVALLDTPLSLAPFCEPLIEPEIALWLATTPAPGMNERELLECIGWVAHGFEIVQSVFPGWKFKAADTIANFGMHGAYRLGPPTRSDRGKSRTPVRGARQRSALRCFATERRSIPAAVRTCSTDRYRRFATWSNCWRAIPSIRRYRPAKSSPREP